MKTWSSGKRVTLLAAICAVVAIAIAIAVAAIDDYTRDEVRIRVEAEYFEELSKVVAREVKKELEENGCNAPPGVEAAMQFLSEERKHMRLQIRGPDWGWQVDRYRFTIRWRSTWIAKFNVDDKTYEAIDVRVNKEFENALKGVVCVPACGRVGCFFGDLLGL